MKLRPFSFLISPSSWFLFATLYLNIIKNDSTHFQCSVTNLRRGFEGIYRLYSQSRRVGKAINYYQADTALHLVSFIDKNMHTAPLSAYWLWRQMAYVKYSLTQIDLNSEQFSSVGTKREDGLRNLVEAFFPHMASIPVLWPALLSLSLESQCFNCLLNISTISLLLIY